MQKNIFLVILFSFLQIVLLWKTEHECGRVCCHVELTPPFAFAVGQRLLCLLCGAACAALLQPLACPPAEQNYINIMKMKTDVWDTVTIDFCAMWLTAAAAAAAGGDVSCADTETGGAFSAAAGGFASSALGCFASAADLKAALLWWNMTDWSEARQSIISLVLLCYKCAVALVLLCLYNEMAMTSRSTCYTLTHQQGAHFISSLW